MTSMHGTLLLQQRMSVKMMLVAPLSTRCSQQTGDSRVAVSVYEHTHMVTHTHTGVDVLLFFYFLTSSGTCVLATCEQLSKHLTQVFEGL